MRSNTLPQLKVYVEKRLSINEALQLATNIHNVFGDIFDLQIQEDDTKLTQSNYVRFDTTALFPEQRKTFNERSDKFYSLYHMEIYVVDYKEKVEISSNDNLVSKLPPIVYNDHFTPDNDNVKKIYIHTDKKSQKFYFYDAYGYLLATMHALNGELTMNCVDINGTSIRMQRIKNSDGCNKIKSTEKIVEYISTAISFINGYYNEERQYVEQIPDADDDEEKYKLGADRKYEEALEQLYFYQKTNFTPLDVENLRKQGPSIGYREAIKKILAIHRKERIGYFLEADETHGIASRHRAEELEYLHSTDNKLGFMIHTVQMLFGKEWYEFRDLFNKISSHGSEIFDKCDE